MDVQATTLRSSTAAIKTLKIGGTVAAQPLAAGGVGEFQHAGIEHQSIRHIQCRGVSVHIAAQNGVT